jgi:hypothetical protein
MMTIGSYPGFAFFSQTGKFIQPYLAEEKS